MELTNARILVAGATGELGSALARALHDHGAQLGLAGRDPELGTGVDRREPVTPA